jgi:preprotein translocase subunit SecA
VTISTNMAGRGTDIVLGGKPASPELAQQHDDEREAVRAAGGLHVIGTAHHESVRIDNQLRGRAGRQGDPGSSQFFVCLDDPLYRKFGQDEIGEIRAALAAGGQEAGTPVEDPAVLRTLHLLRKKVEVENEAIRKDVLKYDLVLHVQRETLYAWRQTLVSGEAFGPGQLVQDVTADLLLHEDHGAIAAEFESLFRRPLELPATGAYDLPGEMARQAGEALADLEQLAGAEIVHEVGRQILLRSIDELWTDHLSDLERLEEGIGLRGYAQIDPVLEWRREATEMWEDLLLRIRQRAVGLWFSLELVQA